MSGSKKKYIIPLLAATSFIVGFVCLFIPFLPFGWAGLATSALIISPYFKPIRNALGYLIKKDKTRLFQRVGIKVAQLYQWAGENEKAKEIRFFIRKTKHRKANNTES